MAGMFDRFEIKGMTLENRFIRSAAWEGMADEQGRVTDQLAGLVDGLAAGGVGLIIPGFAHIMPEAQAVPWQTGVYADDLISGLQRLAEAAHGRGGRICLQIVHGGVQTNPRLAGIDRPAGPSEVGLPRADAKPRELSAAEIAGIVEAFGAAAGRAKAAGFDAVQLHGAHAYLLHQFMSPWFNKRGDRYGGPLHNRARLTYEAYEAVRGEVGPDFPVLIKINSEDFIDGGLELEDSLKAAAELEAMGLDGVEVSGGVPFGDYSPSRTEVDAEEKEAYHRRASSVYKEKLSIPTAVVGGFRSPSVVEEVLANKEADLIAMARPFVREPDLAARWRSGDLEPAACISCNGCFKPIFAGEGIRCIVKEDES